MTGRSADLARTLALLENLREELLHSLPGAAVGLFIVSGALARIAPRFLLGEAVDRAAVFHQFPIHFSLAHLILEGGQVLGWHERVIRALQRQHLALDIPAVLGMRRIQPAMKTHHAGDVRSAASQLDDRRAAKTITDGRDSLWVRQLMPLQYSQAGLGPGTQQVTIALVFARLSTGLLARLRANPLAVNVQRKGIVAELGEHLGAFLLVIGQPLPLVHYEHPGPLSVDRGVVSQITFQDRIALFVLNGLSMNLRLRRQRGTQREQNRNKCSHISTDKPEMLKTPTGTGQACRSHKARAPIRLLELPTAFYRPLAAWDTVLIEIG